VITRSNKTWGLLNIEMKNLKMCQHPLTHKSKPKDAYKILIDPKKNPNRPKLMVFDV